MKSQKFFSWRSNILRIFLTFAMAVIVIRLFQLQIIDYGKYVKLAEEQHVMRNTIVAKRGEIYFLDGEEPVPVVMNSKVWSVIIDPQVAKEYRSKIEKVLREEAGEFLIANLDEAFSSEKLRYYVVARNVPYKNAQKIQEANLDGVWMQGSTKRVYPEGQMASGLLGFVNMDGVGQYGVEGGLNDELAGKNGILKTVKDVNNIPLTIGNENVRVPAVDGKNLVLTIDRNVQNKIEQVLKTRTEEFKLENATAIVMNPRNGHIMAMASAKNYDASQYGKVKDATLFQTDASMNAFEVASVCKTFAMAAAIDMGKMTPETTFYNTDQTIVDGWPINNLTKGHTGNITMQTALSLSLNTGSTQALRLLGDSSTEITQVGKERLYDYYRNKLWFGKGTGVEIAESKGVIIPPNDIKATNARYANMTFGQGFDITLLQLATGFNSVVNGGEYFKPTLVSGEMINGIYQAYDIKTADHDAFYPSTSKTMRKMLYDIRRRYKDLAKFDGEMYIGGKTGTGQVIRDGEYVMDETIATYTGFGAKNADELPEFIVVTKIWEKGKVADGWYNAKPIFDDMSKYLVDYLKMKK